MTKILDSNYITTHVPKMIELRKGFIINGQYYLKDNMQPVPFNTVVHNDSYLTSSGRGYLFLDRTIRYSDNISCGANICYDSILYDSEDERYTYVLTDVESYQYLIKFKEENNRCQIEKISFINSSSPNIKFDKMEEEVDGYIDIYRGGKATLPEKFRYKKSDLVSVTNFALTSGMSSHSSYNYDVDSNPAKNLYFRAGYSSNAASFAYYSNKQSKPIMHTLTSNILTDWNQRHRTLFHSAFEETDEKVTMIYPAAAADSTTTYIKTMEICTFDKINESWSSKQITVQHGEFELKYHSSNMFWASDVWYKTINNKKYIIIYNRDAYNFNTSKMEFFEYKESAGDDENTVIEIELVKVQTFPHGQCGRIIYYNDDEKFRFYGSSKENTSYNSLMSTVYCYELDESSLEMVKTFNIEGSIREFGFDKDRNLYILWNDMSVTRHNDRTVANFNARFENSLYEYQGEDIETNLLISTTNLEGQFLEKEARLDIKGNAIFAESRNKTITVTTSGEGELAVPIVITGAGSLNIFPKIKA